MKNIPLDFVENESNSNDLKEMFNCTDKNRIILFRKSNRSMFDSACCDIEKIYFGQNRNKLSAIKDFLDIAYYKYKYISEYYPKVNISKYDFEWYMQYYTYENSYSACAAYTKSYGYKAYRINNNIIESMITMMNYLFQDKKFFEVLNDIEYLNKCHPYIKIELKKVYDKYADIIRNSR